ncbi:hypothetical protein J4N46_02215 [Capnocytophaga sp. Marseille-Q4570]|jgi:hypothetical protein|uniref:Phage protein n=1 Tax=Capnocytophaga bilenii TaxID=2819369 RepID=A0ABS3PVA5_9FLAO|nr:hypothetical protein [Capnocytophaga bilenii]MBO1883260.1 hypothetical protein [Capnocytophaga bilenii]
MAREIKPTPTLVGKEAEAFWDKIENYDAYLKEKGIKFDIKKIEADANYLKSIFKPNGRNGEK